MAPVMNPMISLARRDDVNEPCPQSCMMMNVRTNSPAVTGNISTVSHQAWLGPQNIRAKAADRGTSVVTICRVARPVLLSRKAAARSWIDRDEVAGALAVVAGTGIHNPSP